MSESINKFLHGFHSSSHLDKAMESVERFKKSLEILRRIKEDTQKIDDIPFEIEEQNGIL